MNNYFKIFLIAIIIAVLPSLTFGQMVAVDDLPFTNEEVPKMLNVVANDINGGGGILTVTLLSTTVNGTLDLIEADEILYTPFLNFFGTDTFSYKVCNGAEPSPECDKGFVLISVFPIADYPVAVNDSYTIAALTNGNFYVLENDINVDAEVLEATIIEAPLHGVATITGDENIITYTPASSFAGQDTLQYSACKSGSTIYCDTAFVFINVTTTNFNAPVAVNDFYTTTLFQTKTYSPLLNDTDADGDALQLQSIFYTSFSGTISQSGNTIIYSTSIKANDTLQYIVCDINAPSLCDTGQIIFQVINLKVPDSFSPNGDGINDKLVIDGLEDYPDFIFAVYNRWGDVVFETKDPTMYWDGTSNILASYLPSGQMAEGTYYFTLNPGSDFETLKGYIVLKR
ncbi:MAG: gliding motility-associated C-terminal domain-containing protein [Chitinophagales bacterium]|nr:gliding motility-associated C-terminal domain-containing protein [Chitinophagales bacterium]MBP9704580.1 gliding motility-associated C-terminal domain-containing protein [Chitinophagales bacterium]